MSAKIGTTPWQGNIRDISEISNNLTLNCYLVIKSIKPYIIRAQAYECAAKVRDIEKMVILELAEEFSTKKVNEADIDTNTDIDTFFRDNYGINIFDGITCHEVFNTNDNFYSLATMFFNFNYQPKPGEESMYQRQKDKIIAELRDRKLTDLLTEK